ncbi:dihydrofolate reductase family protein [Kitasatospora terrestris]|uniref:Dihydrofolate reductase family protein n=1 Tax=Kitasatospora terrestris TaxID=258051 RepID=A0ABP9EIH8_9ACTN
MRKIILMMSVSLDGYIERPDRRIDWHRVDDELHGFLNDELRTMGAFIHGRVTYDLMAAYWPTADQDRQAPPAIVDFAGIWRSMPKVVYSRTLDHADWNTTVRHEVDPAEVRAMKAGPGGDIVVGGADLGAAFREHGLVDAYRVLVHPVLIGRGKRLFPPTDLEQPLTLTRSRTFSNGVVLLDYVRDDAA